MSNRKTVMCNQSQKILKYVYLSVSYVGKVRPGKVEHESSKKTQQRKSHQPRITDDATQGNILAWCLTNGRTIDSCKPDEGQTTITLISPILVNPCSEISMYTSKGNSQKGRQQFILLFILVRGTDQQGDHYLTDNWIDSIPLVILRYTKACTVVPFFSPLPYSQCRRWRVPP